MVVIKYRKYKTWPLRYILICLDSALSSGNVFLSIWTWTHHSQFNPYSSTNHSTILSFAPKDTVYMRPDFCNFATFGVVNLFQARDVG